MDKVGIITERDEDGRDIESTPPFAVTLSFIHAQYTRAAQAAPMLHTPQLRQIFLGDPRADVPR
jgi:hypothetical protein